MHETISPFMTIAESWQAYLPLYAILIPILGAIAVGLKGKDEKTRDYILVGTTALSFLLVLLMYFPVLHGVEVSGHHYKGLSSALSFLPSTASIPEFKFTFRVDPAGFLVALIVSFIYLVSNLYSISFMKIEKKQTRYAVCSLLTFAANLGVILAGDFLTLFIFFEGLVIFPYAMIAHRENKESISGANIYAYLGVVTGLCLLMGIILLYSFTGSVEIKPMAELINAKMSTEFKYLVAALMIFGFGGKAGLFLEHFWMPSAYPVAPSPTAAMSSGAMIKAGAYGIFRVVNIIFVPENGANIAEWITVSNIGYVLIFVGIITMFFGVLNALISENSNRMLAYHSISQMGYIVMGLGCAAYMGTSGAMGLAGSLYHIINHSLFKVGLFLGVGAVFYRTGEMNMYKLGGLWRNMPVAAVTLFIAVCGISGIPFFNGFASKTLLHHAINESFDYSVALGHPDQLLKFAEIIFVITAAGTFASNLKLFVLTFLRERPEKYKDVQPCPLPMKVAMISISVLILFIGFFPNFLIETIIGPALAYFNFDNASHGYHLLYNTHQGSSGLAILYPNTQTFGAVLHNILGTSDAIILGGVLFILGFKFGWFHVNVPEGLTAKYYYENALIKFKKFCKEIMGTISDYHDQLITLMMVYIWFPLVNPNSVLRWAEKELGVKEDRTELHWHYDATHAYVAFCEKSAVFDAGELDKSGGEIGKMSLSNSGVFDYFGVIDGMVNMVAVVIQSWSKYWRKIQTGLVQNYLLAMFIGIFILLSYYIFL